MFTFRCLPATMTLLVGFFVTGCGPSLVAVSGIVTLDSTPIEGAIVTFVSEDGANSYSGRSDSGGSFVIGVGDKIGVMPGTYKVIVVKTPIVEGVEGMALGGAEYNKMMEKMTKDQGSKSAIPMGPMVRPSATASAPKSEFAKSLVPAIYGNVTSTPFTVKVPLEKSPVALELTSKK